MLFFSKWPGYRQSFLASFLLQLLLLYYYYCSKTALRCGSTVFFFSFQDEKSLFFFPTFLTYLCRFSLMERTERKERKKKNGEGVMSLILLHFFSHFHLINAHHRLKTFFFVGASPRFCRLLFHFFFFSLRIANLRIACVHCVVVVNLPFSLLLVPCWSLFCAATVERCSGRRTVHTPRSLISLSSDLQSSIYTDMYK